MEIYSSVDCFPPKLEWCLVLAKFPTRWNGSGLGLEPEPNRFNGFITWKPRTIAFGPGSTSKPGHCMRRFLAAIKYLSSDRIVT